jgi:hypothetical protein
MISFTKTGSIPSFSVENPIRFIIDNSVGTKPPRIGLAERTQKHLKNSKFTLTFNQTLACKQQAIYTKASSKSSHGSIHG